MQQTADNKAMDHDCDACQKWRRIWLEIDRALLGFDSLISYDDSVPPDIAPELSMVARDLRVELARIHHTWPAAVDAGVAKETMDEEIAYEREKRLQAENALVSKTAAESQQSRATQDRLKEMEDQMASLVQTAKHHRKRADDLADQLADARNRLSQVVQDSQVDKEVHQALDEKAKKAVERKSDEVSRIKDALAASEVSRKRSEAKLRAETEVADSASRRSESLKRHVDELSDAVAGLEISAAQDREDWTERLRAKEAEFANERAAWHAERARFELDRAAQIEKQYSDTREQEWIEKESVWSANKSSLELLVQQLTNQLYDTQKDLDRVQQGLPLDDDNFQAEKELSSSMTAKVKEVQMNMTANHPVQSSQHEPENNEEPEEEELSLELDLNVTPKAQPINGDSSSREDQLINLLQVLEKEKTSLNQKLKRRDLHNQAHLDELERELNEVNSMRESSQAEAQKYKDLAEQAVSHLQTADVTISHLQREVEANSKTTLIMSDINMLQQAGLGASPPPKDSPSEKPGRVKRKDDKETKIPRKKENRGVIKKKL